MSHVTQEPGPWELQRTHEQLRADMREGFAQLNSRLDRLVSTDAFAAEQRRVDEKLKDLADDIAAEREQRQIAIGSEKRERERGDSAQQSALDKLIANQKWIIVAVLLPVGLFLANLYLARGK